MNLALVAMFWASVALIVYVFIGFPAAVALGAVLRPRPWRREQSEPSITIVIAAHNEAGAVTAKIANLLSLDYPADRVEILIGSDGSTDSTADELRRVNDSRVRTFLFAERKGKPSILNALVPEAKGDIIVFADVRQLFDPHVLRALTQSFADAEIGAVTGDLIVRNDDGSYWRYEKFIRSRESIVKSTVVVTGAIYAIRRELFEPIPSDTIADDLLIPLRIARRGFRVVVDSEARAYDVASATRRQEWTRKVRTVAGAFQLFSREPWLFNPMKNPLWWQTMSHKALRLAVAPLQLAAFASNALLATQSAFYQALLLAQLFFYALAVIGAVLPQNWKRPRVINVPYVFCLLSWVTVMAFLRWITNRQAVTWEKMSPLKVG